jgi:cytochrome P450
VTVVPPKPASRPDRVSWLRYVRLFRKDIFASQPARLYRAWMAEFQTPFFRSYMVNQPDLVKLVLSGRPDDFPKSEEIREGLKTLLGDSVFVTNGETWKRQRRIIDPAFEGGRLRDTFPAMVAAAEAGLARLNARAGADPVEVEEECSYLAADVIFRTLFSIPITDTVASAVFREFRAYQRTQPLLNLASFVKLPRWFPRFRSRETVRTSRRIRRLLVDLTDRRAAEIAAGTAPDDLATKIMTAVDPVTGRGFDSAEMVDQVAIFFLAGHETSASALAWALYLLALSPEVQDRVADEAQEVLGAGSPGFSAISRLSFTRDVFRETLRLYPPVPMMVRTATCPEHFRDRDVQPGSHVVLSPWHLHRHERLWDDPDGFDPDRWKTENGRTCLREAFIPFSAGPRVCTGAGFAMIEGPLMLAMLARAFRFETVPGRDPVPVAHLTVRSEDGIHLRVHPRAR